MKTMRLHKITSITENPSPLEAENVDIPEPGDNEVLLKIKCCGVCHTELDEIEGRTPPPKFPVVPGHEVVGVVEKIGNGVKNLNQGERVGVAWIYSACGKCEFCREGNENLCEEFTATGRDKNGGYAEYMIANADFVYPIPETIDDEMAAPMMCAGAIGYRSLMLADISNGKKLGLTGFGASGHLVLKLARYLYPESDICVFARSKNQREHALELGAAWAGKSEDYSPEKLHAIIDTTPAWKPVVEAMKNLLPSGRLVINAIRKEYQDQEYLLNLNYERHLWMEKEIKSVANVTRSDVSGFLKLAAKIPIEPDIELMPLDKANDAILQLKKGGGKGAVVLKME